MRLAAQEDLTYVLEELWVSALPAELPPATSPPWKRAGPREGGSQPPAPSCTQPTQPGKWGKARCVPPRPSRACWLPLVPLRWPVSAPFLPPAIQVPCPPARALKAAAPRLPHNTPARASLIWPPGAPLLLSSMWPPGGHPKKNPSNCVVCLLGQPPPKFRRFSCGSSHRIFRATACC